MGIYSLEIVILGIDICGIDIVALLLHSLISILMVCLKKPWTLDHRVLVKDSDHTAHMSRLI